MHANNTMRYIDARRRVEKKANFTEDKLHKVCLTGETAAAEWLKSMMLAGASVEAVRPWILAPISSAPRGSVTRGHIVCTCHDVSEAEIRGEASHGLAVVQAKLRCGTECGSCLPAVKRLVAEAGATTHKAAA
jgi:assimilatory nitrate reductase catalytic subunit